MKPMVTSVLALAVVVGCTKQDDSHAEDELRAAITAYRTALNTGDSVSFFALLAPDVEVLPPGSQPVRGAGVRDMFRPLFIDVKADLAPFTNEELTVNTDLGIQRYSYQLTTSPRAGGPATSEVGSGLHVWKRTPEGRWLVIKDIWTNPKS